MPLKHHNVIKVLWCSFIFHITVNWSLLSVSNMTPLLYIGAVRSHFKVILMLQPNHTVI